MGIYDRYVLPRLVTCCCGTKPVLKQRAKVVPKVHGRVLEIGMGAGHNLPYYDFNHVDHVVGLDPCETSWKLAQPRVRSVPFDVEFMAGSAEEIPLDDASVDSVLLTFSLCTIPNPARALSEAKRVLKAGGKLVFCEHGKAPDPEVVKWQDRVNPVWKKLFGGCHLNRDIPGLIEEGGFSVTEMEKMYLPNTPRIAAFNIWGSASA